MYIVRKNPLEGGKTLLCVYLGATALSFLYLLVTGTWNGDFIAREITLSPYILLGVFLLTLLASYYSYYIYKLNICRREFVTDFPYNINFLRNFTWFLFVTHIIMLGSGYGVMETEGMKMTMNPVHILRAILIKINPRIWGLTYMLVSNNKKNLIVTSILFVVSSLFAHSLGGIFMLCLILVYKYAFVYRFIRKHIFVALLIFYLTPSLILFAFNFRGNLRGGGDMAETEYIDVVLGKLCGRISSLSNNGYILENIYLVYRDRAEIPELFYLYDTLHYFGYRPNFKSTGSYINMNMKRTDNMNSSTMSGIIGALVMSYAVSSKSLFFSLLYVLCSVPLVFYLLRKMGLSNYMGIGLFITLAYMQSGDSSEIANAIYVLIFMWIVLNLFGKKKYARLG